MTGACGCAEDVALAVRWCADTQIGQVLAASAESLAWKCHASAVLVNAVASRHTNASNFIQPKAVRDRDIDLLRFDAS
jgi:hypothetical protein